jgi:hypothetical protein
MVPHGAALVPGRVTRQRGAMGEIVNLRRARRQRARDTAAEAAAANRARHGRTRAERDAERLEQERARRALDGARQEEPRDA